MSGRSLTWATTIGTTAGHLRESGGVCGRGEEGFSCPIPGREAAQKLIQLRQDTRRVADYSVDFRTLAAKSAWNQEALFVMFLHGISEEVKDELPTDLDSLIAVDHLHRWPIATTYEEVI
jgi:hypothetical protein